MYQINTLSWFCFNVLSYLNNNYSAGCCSTQTHYSDSEPNSICSFSLMLLVSWRSSKYQFYSLLFDQTGDETIDLLHSMSISQLLHHTSGLYYCCTLCQYPNYYTTQAVYIITIDHASIVVFVSFVASYRVSRDYIIHLHWYERLYTLTVNYNYCIVEFLADSYANDNTS